MVLATGQQRIVAHDPSVARQEIVEEHRGTSGPQLCQGQHLEFDIQPRGRRKAHAQGVLVLSCGTYGNILRFLPPLSISDELLIEGLDVLAATLSEL